MMHTGIYPVWMLWKTYPQKMWISFMRHYSGEMREAEISRHGR